MVCILPPPPLSPTLSPCHHHSLANVLLPWRRRRELQKYIAGLKVKDVTVEFSVQVLTTGFWPTFKQTDIALPADLQVCFVSQ